MKAFCKDEPASGSSPPLRRGALRFLVLLGDEGPCSETGALVAPVEGGDDEDDIFFAWYWFYVWTGLGLSLSLSLREPKTYKLSVNSEL